MFIRERLNRAYSTSTYFWAKAVAELPILVVMPAILVSSSYFVLGLQSSPAWKFWAQRNIILINWFITLHKINSWQYHRSDDNWSRIWACGFYFHSFNRAGDVGCHHTSYPNDAFCRIFRQSRENPILFL